LFGAFGFVFDVVEDVQNVAQHEAQKELFDGGSVSLFDGFLQLGFEPGMESFVDLLHELLDK
jgi:hypothetical protein